MNKTEYLDPARRARSLLCTPLPGMVYYTPTYQANRKFPGKIERIIHWDKTLVSYTESASTANTAS